MFSYVFSRRNSFFITELSSQKCRIFFFDAYLTASLRAHHTNWMASNDHCINIWSLWMTKKRSRTSSDDDSCEEKSSSSPCFGSQLKDIRTSDRELNAFVGLSVIPPDGQVCLHRYKYTVGTWPVVLTDGELCQILRWRPRWCALSLHHLLNVNQNLVWGTTLITPWAPRWWNNHESLSSIDLFAPRSRKSRLWKTSRLAYKESWKDVSLNIAMMKKNKV